MALPIKARRRRVLTSSAVQLGSAGAGDSGYQERLGMQWQTRALRYIDLVPELNFASRFYSRMLKQLSLFPAMLDERGELTRIDSGLPVHILNRIRDPGGRHSQILGNYGRLMFSTGEGNLFGYNLETDEETWLFVWNDELKVEKDGDTIKKITWEPTSGEKYEYGPDEAVVYRFWTSHPRSTGEADSPMRSIVEGDVAEELIALTRAVKSTATTRATNGMLLIPSEISPPEAETADDSIEDQGLISDLGRHLELQVEQAGSPAAVAPWLLEAAYDYIDRIRWVQMHDPQNDYMESALRTEAVTRIAHGIDFPAEALLGIGQTNHWAALQILMDMWRSHGAPIAQQFCDDLTSTYMRNALRAEEFPDWRDVVVTYDESQVVVKPDRADDADKAWDRGQLSSEGYRAMKNIPDDFALTDPKEIDFFLEVSGKNQAQADPNPSEGPPPPGPEGDSGRKTRQTASHELAAIELALMRCRELAGIRIRQKARQFPQHVEPLNGEPFAQIAPVLGKVTLKEMGLSNTLSLVAGGADNLRSLLIVKGYSLASADAVGEMVEVLAARTLFESKFPVVPSHFLGHLEIEEAA